MSSYGYHPSEYRGLWAFFYHALLPGLWILGVLIAAIITLVVFFAYLFGRPECLAKMERMGLPAEWTFHGGCVAQVRGQWLPIKWIIPVERDGRVEFIVRPYNPEKD